MAKLQNNIGRTLVPSCDAALGDARCGVALSDIIEAGTVTAVASRRAFTDSGLAQAAGYFSGGEVTFLDGLNDGISAEVKEHAAGGLLTLQLPLPYDITTSDTFTIIPGCDKTKATCIAKFDNLVNFRGFSFVPGQDQILLVGSQ
jgi:uncharacterized phage protein (TIGR02218 family)